MKYKNYDEYLQSDEWKAKAEARRIIDNNRCVICECIGTNFNKLNCHHISYRNIYNEDIERDLVTVCNTCHLSIHKMMNRITNASTGQRGWRDTLTDYVKHIEVDNIQ